jgi:hypothetical protein
MRLWNAFTPSIRGPAVDLASLKTRMEVVTKNLNATGRTLKELSEEDSQQLYEWMSKGLTVNL